MGRIVVFLLLAFLHSVNAQNAQVSKDDFDILFEAIENNETQKIAEYGNKVYEFTEYDIFWETETGIYLLNALAKTNEKTNIDKAKIYYKRLLPLLERNFGENSEEYIGTLFSYSLLLTENEEFEESLQLLRKVDSIANTTKTQINYHLIIKRELASINYQKGNLRESNNIYYSIIESVEKDFPQFLYTIYIGLGHNYLELGEIDLAVQNYQLASQLVKDVNVSQFEKYNCEVYLCNALIYSGDYDKAIPILKNLTNVLRIKKEDEEELTSLYFTAYDYLSTIMIKRGEYKEAEQLLIQNLSEKILTYGANSQEAASTHINIGTLFETMQVPKKAKEHYYNALDITGLDANKECDYLYLYPKTKILSITTKNLELSDESNFKYFEKEYMDLLESCQNLKHTNFYQILVNDASVYYLNNNYLKKSKDLIEYALKLNEETPFFKKVKTVLLMNLAHIYFEEKKYEESINKYKKVLNEAKDRRNKEKIFLGLINNYLQTKNQPQLVKYFTDYLDLKAAELQQKNLILTLSDLNEVLASSDFFLEKNFPISILHTQRIHEISDEIFRNKILYQNLSLRNQSRIRQTILEKGDQKTKELYQSYINNSNRLIRLETEFTEESIAEYKRLSEVNESLEKELIKHSAEFADAQKDLQIQWTDLRDKLAPNEAIVDLVSFHLFEDDWTDKIQYAAFIVRKNSEQPEFVSLFEEKELSSLLSLQNHDSIYQSDKLYQLFIKPIENKLSGINTLYYSPSGLAHQIDFSAIALLGDDQMLDKYKIHLLSTPAQLRKFKELALHSNSEIILYGDIDYDKESHQNSDKQLNETELHSFSDLLTRSGIGGWGYLPGTKKEVELIEHFAKEKLIKTKVYKGSEATKESLMTLSGKTEPFVLHLATHGFFFENTVQKLPENFMSTRSFNQMVQVSANPMLRSGLVLSGANKSWHKDTSGDGIITAAEIANLDLRNCDLVVLSACDTGLGDINGSEGVYGLQRAFKLAGVKNIIMSLWKVPDEQTSEMFQLFYQELLNGKSIHQSFVEAQTKMKEKYSPYYWAGFVLLE